MVPVAVRGSPINLILLARVEDARERAYRRPPTRSACLMLSVEPPARPRTLANPAHGAAAVAVLHSASQTRVNALETTATHEAAEHEFEIARLVRIARANRHAETEG